MSTELVRTPVTAPEASRSGALTVAKVRGVPLALVNSCSNPASASPLSTTSVSSARLRASCSSPNMAASWLASLCAAGSRPANSSWKALTNSGVPSRAVALIIAGSVSMTWASRSEESRSARLCDCSLLSSSRSSTVARRASSRCCRCIFSRLRARVTNSW